MPEYTAERMAQLCKSPCLRHLMPTEWVEDRESSTHAAALQELVTQGTLKKDVKSGQTMGKFKNEIKI